HDCSPRVGIPKKRERVRHRRNLDFMLVVARRSSARKRLIYCLLNCEGASMMPKPDPCHPLKHVHQQPTLGRTEMLKVRGGATEYVLPEETPGEGFQF